MSINDDMKKHGIKDDTFYEIPNFHKVPEDKKDELIKIAKRINNEAIRKGEFCIGIVKNGSMIEKALVFFIHNGDFFAKKLSEVELLLLEKRPSTLASIHTMMRRSVTGEAVQ